MTERPASVRSAIDRTRELILRDGVIVCVRFDAGPSIVDACRAAARGGLTVFEITLTTPGALDAIEALREEPGLVVGAGTVLRPEQAHEVADAGGRFALSPVFDADVFDAATARDLLAVPGAATPKEILTAQRHGASLVKVFPAQTLGGPEYLRAIRGPLNDVDLVPTSGPTSETFEDWIDAGAVAVGVGREIFPPGFDARDVERNARRVREAMDRARERRAK